MQRGPAISIRSGFWTLPDANPEKKQEETPQPSASQTQPRPRSESDIPAEVVDLIGGGEWTRTTDLRIMSRPADVENKADQQDSSAECGEVRQNPQTGRKQNGGGE